MLKNAKRKKPNDGTGLGSCLSSSRLLHGFRAQKPGRLPFTWVSQARLISSCQNGTLAPADPSLVTLALEVPLMSSPCIPTPVPVAPVATGCWEPIALLNSQGPGICKESEKPSRNLLWEVLCALCGGHTPAPSCRFLPCASKVSLWDSLVMINL